MSKVSGYPTDYPTEYEHLNKYLIGFSINHPRYADVIHNKEQWDELIELITGVYVLGINVELSHEDGKESIR